MQATAYFRPSQKRQADLAATAEVGKIPVGNQVFAPSGWQFSWHGRRLDVNLTEDWAPQFRRAYGYVVEIKSPPP